MRTARQAAYFGVTPVPGVQRRLLGLDITKRKKMKGRSGFRKNDDLLDDGFGGYDVEPCQRIVGMRHCEATRVTGFPGRLACVRCGAQRPL